MIGFWKISIINVILQPAEHSGVNCPDGGIGRRARLKIWLSQGSAGSIPVLGTMNNPQHLLGIIHLIIAGSLPAGRQGFLFWAQKVLNVCWGLFYKKKDEFKLALFG